MGGFQKRGARSKKGHNNFYIKLEQVGSKIVYEPCTKGLFKKKDRNEDWGQKLGKTTVYL